MSSNNNHGQISNQNIPNNNPSITGQIRTSNSNLGNQPIQSNNQILQQQQNQSNNIGNIPNGDFFMLGEKGVTETFKPDNLKKLKQVIMPNYGQKSNIDNNIYVDYNPSVKKDISNNNNNPNSEKENISDKEKNSELTEINIYKKNNINMKGNQSTKKIENKAIYENHLSYKYQEGDFGYSAQSRKKLKTKNENNDRTESIYKRRYEKIDANMNMKTNKGYNKMSFSSNLNNAEKNSMNSSTEIEKIVRKRKRHKKVNYTFNIIETIFVSFCQCCLWKNLKRKNNLNEKAKI